MCKARRIFLIAVAATSICFWQGLGTGRVARAGATYPNQPRAASADGLNRHAGADVTIFFEGLLALCLDGNHQMEVGALRNPHHELTIEIRTIQGDHSTTVRYPTDPDQDVWIETSKKSGSRVALYENQDIAFSRADNKGDPEDFRWVTDLEGTEFHNTKLAIKPE